MLKRVCVFCGSSLGSNHVYIQAANELGRAIADRGLGLVYGGSSVGLMGVVASAALAAGTEVIGVMPTTLAGKEPPHGNLSDLRIVDSMHERKALMAELADGFIALPGGLGTLDEMFEALSWAQLGMHKKPCGFLNVKQYYGKLIDFLDHAVSQRFVGDQYRNMIFVDDNPEKLLRSFSEYQAPESKWAARPKVR